jgi:putative spermidine/putrescine transport system substrate-binding protein
MSVPKKKIAVILCIVAIVSFAVGAGFTYYLFPPPVVPKEPLVVSTWGGAWYDAPVKVAKKFTESTGIPVVFTTHSSVLGEAVPKIVAQMPNPPIDVLFLSREHLPTCLEKGILVPLEESEIPNLKDYPDVVKWIENGKVWAVGIYSYSYCLGWRTDFIKEPIDEYKDLLRPELKGKVAITSPVYAAGQWLVAFALANGGNEYEIDKGFELIKNMAKAGVFGTIVHDDPSISKVISTGEAWVAMGIVGDFYSLYKEGAPITITKIPKDAKTIIGWDGIAVINGPKKELAKKFVNFMISAEAASQYCDIVGFIPNNLKGEVYNKELLNWNLSPEEIEKYGYVADVKYMAAHYDEWMKRWEDEIVPLIGKA